MKPIIGITTYGRYESPVSTKYYKHYFATPSLYVDAVRRAGGLPVLLPPDEENIEEILQRIDGVIMAGGGDIDPKHYNGNINHPMVVRIDHERDAHEMRIIKLMAESKDKPVLCICRGMQLLNVTLGGTMTEHIPDIRDVDIHRDADGYWNDHDIDVVETSLLAKAMDTTKVQTVSGHHQAVDKIAPNLTIVASAPDGTVEGLELKGHPWMVGVQWHPERSAKDDVTQQKLFDVLVSLAREGVREAT